MGDLVCEECGARQEYDPHPDPRCLECGAAAFPATRCYGCHGIIPLKARCPKCNIPALPENLYPAALMLRYKGVDLLSLAERVKQLSATERAEWEARYFESWKKVDDAMEGLVRTLETRITPSMRGLILENLYRLQAADGVTPEAVLTTIDAYAGQFRSMPHSIAPFPLAVCKAIHEAAAWKLGHLNNRIRSERPARGLNKIDEMAVVEHAKALSFGPGDPRFAVGAAYLNAFTYGHSFVLGEVFNRNVSTPVFALHGTARTQKSLLPGVPVCLVGRTAVVWAVGPRPTPEITQRWVPEGYVYVPREGPSIHLHETEGLRAFLRVAKIPITPKTLSVLIHLLLAPFPWDTRVTSKEEILTDWEPWENRLADQRSEGSQAAKLLGISDEAIPFKQKLEIRLEPVGKTLIYRPPELEVL